ncbi:hypothetical protein F4Z99_09395 [Candidatus Poribacteria bacterium]|nr:hypothetical protein [Candidatus Poribacteria bacterium]MYB00585.1 hypothetical protein [Candidatus Poribacteria bacterium]
MNENFINTWVSNVELGRTPNKRAFIAARIQQGFKPFDKTHPLAEAIITGWKLKSPADSLVISTDLNVLGRLPVNERTSPYNGPKGYLLFLQEALDEKRPGLPEPAREPSSMDWNTFLGTAVESGAIANDDLSVVLSREHPKKEVLSVFRAPGHGLQDYTVVEIDTTAFKDGGMLVIDISVGSAETKGAFDLYDGETELPTEGIPHEALTSAWEVPPGEKQTIKYPFAQGKVFKLGATGSWFHKKGEINGFLAEFSVEPTPEKSNQN